MTSSLTKLYHSLKWSYRCNKQEVEELEEEKGGKKVHNYNHEKFPHLQLKSVCGLLLSYIYIKQEIQLLVFCPSYLNFLYYISLAAQNMSVTTGWGSCSSVQNTVFWHVTSHNLVDSTNTLKGLATFIFWVEAWASHAARWYRCRDRTIWTRASAVPILYILPFHPTKVLSTWNMEAAASSSVLVPNGKLLIHILRNCHHN